MQLEMLHFYVIDLASEYENEHGLELLCGTCLVECCVVPRTDSGFFRPEVSVEP